MRHDVPSHEEDEGSLDAEYIIDWLSYGWRAIRCHPLAVLAPTVLIGAAAMFLAWVVPNRYFVETKLLAPRPDLIAILTNPGRTLSADARANARATSELVRRGNLVAAIAETGLLEQWRATRSPILRLKDRLMMGGDVSDEQLFDILVATLESRFVAWTELQDDGSGLLTVGLTWNDPEMTVRLLEATIKGFLDFRERNDLAVLGESIAILEARLAEARRDLDLALASEPSVPKKTAASTPVTAPSPEPNSDEIVRLVGLRSSITSRRRALDELLSYRQRRIAELQTQLAEQRVIYSDTHPIVVDTRRSLEAVAVDSPQIASLRKEIDELEALYIAQGGTAADLVDGPARAASSAAAPVVPPEVPTVRPAVDYVRSRVTAAIARYYGISDRLEGARLELDAVRASVPFRYAVIKPALPPRTPSNRRVKWAILASGILGGLFLGMLAALGLEARRGRIVQAWQVERGLGLAILAEVPTSPLLHRQDLPPRGGPSRA